MNDNKNEIKENDMEEKNNNNKNEIFVINQQKYNLDYTSKLNYVNDILNPNTKIKIII